MAITVGQARQYAVDICYDMAGDKADTLAIYFVRQALQRLWRAYPWTFFAARNSITLDPQETGTATATQGASTITKAAGGDWASKYATTSESWDLLITGDATKTFRFASVAGTTGTLTTGSKWTAAAVTGAAYTATRFRYSLPDNFTRGHERVQDASTKWEVTYLPPAQFDRLRSEFPGYRASNPEFYTLRDATYIEFFPAPGTAYGVVEMSYTRVVTLPTTATSNGTSLDWPEQYEHLMHLAIEVEAARHQGKAAQVPYAICAPELERALASAKALDTSRGGTVHAMRLGMPRPPGRFDAYIKNTATWSQV